MALTEDQIKELKKQLFEQVQNLPPDKKKEAEEQIKEMSSEALESMLKQQQQGRQQDFRMIANKEIESVVVGESNDALAVLEINPTSIGHTLIIPKNPVSKKEEMPQNILNFAQSIAKKIEFTLKPEKINLIVNEKFGEAVIDLIPIYPDSMPKKEKKQATKEELEEIKRKINTEVIKKELEKIKIEKENNQEEKVKLKRRIP